MRGSISAEAAWRNNCLEFSEVEVADRLQRLNGGTVLEVLWQGFQPGGIVTLQRGQLGDKRHTNAWRDCGDLVVAVSGLPVSQRPEQHDSAPGARYRSWVAR